MIQQGTRHGRKLLTIGFALGLSTAGVVGLLMAPGTTEAQQVAAPAPKAPTIVHLSNYSNNPHAAFMALQAAQALQNGGSNVILFLDLEGIRLADSRVPFEAGWGSADASTQKLYESFTKNGGQVLVCAHCASVGGLDAKSLRHDARMASGAEFANAVQSSAHIIDF